jgi:DNA polymerase-1
MHPRHKQEDGLRAVVPFRRIWCVDFEFQSGGGERPRPVCMVAREIVTGQVIRLWQDELRRLTRAPFDTGPDIVVVAYMASAEIGCFLELGWNPPEKILDLFVEHRVETNGRYLPMGNGMLGALAVRGQPHIDVDHKETMRSLILDRTTWNDAEREAILDYCESDVDGLVVLLESMAASIDWPRALVRGSYMSAVARMERRGVPVDRALYRTFVEQWPEIRGQLVEEVGLTQFTR